MKFVRNLLLALGILSGFVFGEAVVNLLANTIGDFWIMLVSLVLTIVLVSLGAGASMVKRMV